MGTFSSIQTRVLNRVIDAPTTVVNEVPALINLAITKLQVKHNFKVMEAELAFVSNRLASDSGRFLSLIPATFKEFRGEPFWIKNDGTVRQMQTAQKRGDVWGPDYIDNADIGFPLVMIFEPGINTDGTYDIDLYPLPDGNSDYPDGEYRIFLPIWQYLAPLSQPGDSNWFTLNAEEWIVNYAVGEAFALDWDETRMAVWKQRSMEFFNDVVLQDKRQRLAGVTTLVPHRLGARQSKLRL